MLLKQIYKLTIILFLSVTVTTPVNAGTVSERIKEELSAPTKNYSLQEILQFVLEQSIQIKTVKLSKQISRANLLVEQNRYHSNLNNSITSSQAAPSIMSGRMLGLGDSFLINQNKSQNYQIGWSQKYRYGIQFSLTYLKSIFNSNFYQMATLGDTPTKLFSIDTINMDSVTFGVSIPLFQDLGDVNYASLKQRKIELKYADLQLKQTQLTILNTISKIYWNLVGLQKNIHVLKKSINLSKQLLKENRTKYQTGTINITDVQQSETQLSRNQQALIEAEIEEQQLLDQVRIALDLGNIQINILPDAIPKMHQQLSNFDELLKMALKENPELNRLQAMLEHNEQDLTIAKNKLKPDIDLKLQYTLNSFGNDTEEIQKNFGYDELKGYQFGLTWKVPLFDKSTPQEIAKKELAYQKTVLAMNNIKTTIQINLQTILRNLKSGLHENKTIKKQVLLSKNLMEKEIELSTVGRSDSYRVSVAQQNYIQAQFSEIMSRIKSEINFIQLITLTGQIFDHFNLKR